MYNIIKNTILHSSIGHFAYCGHVFDNMLIPLHGKVECLLQYMMNKVNIHACMFFSYGEMSRQRESVYVITIYFRNRSMRSMGAGTADIFPSLAVGRLLVQHI